MPTGKHLLPALVAFGVLLAVAAPAMDIPPPPEDQRFVSDYASLLKEGSHERIFNAQKEAFEKYNTPIIVVTVASMSRYGADGVSIEDFARHWFNKWRIGTLDAGDQGANKGILLMVSVGDRKARIELGADWGRDWDPTCQQIMDDVIIPQFKKDDYSEGITLGVEQLAAMAQKGPESAPPPPSLIKQLENKIDENPKAKTVRSLNPYPLWGSLLMIVGGIACIIAGIALPEHRKWLLIAGGVLIVLGISWILILIIASLFARGRSSGGGGGFGGYSGGGFSGGFSGGGGASGSW